MTPLQIHMLLHFHSRASSFPDIGAPSQMEALNFFRDEGLIESPTNIDAPRLTQRGKAYVALLCAMPLPVAHWSIPGPWAPSYPAKEMQ